MDVAEDGGLLLTWHPVSGSNLPTRLFPQWDQTKPISLIAANISSSLAFPPAEIHGTWINYCQETEIKGLGKNF